MALIFYARVSSQGQNLDRQLVRSKEVKADKVFTDKFSGKTTNRPGLKAMLQFIREGDTVEVISLDRLSRNYQDIQHLVQRFKDIGVKLVVDDLPQTHTGNELVDQFMLDMMINLMWLKMSVKRLKNASGKALNKPKSVEPTKAGLRSMLLIPPIGKVSWSLKVSNAIIRLVTIKARLS